jgi:NAD(P)-dependent dehydrogenase (short-subunit alcohol dehydrogenase family)
MMPVFDLSNKIVLITGIGAVGDGWGNGTTMATVCARQGAIVFGCDINVEAANKAANTIRNDLKVKNHPCRKAEGNIVDTMQEPIVRAKALNKAHEYD